MVWSHPYNYPESAPHMVSRLAKMGMRAEICYGADHFRNLDNKRGGDIALAIIFIDSKPDYTGGFEWILNEIRKTVEFDKDLPILLVKLEKSAFAINIHGVMRFDQSDDEFRSVIEGLVEKNDQAE